MTTVGITELKAQLSRYVNLVARGERVLITDRGRPVAVIVAPEADEDEHDLAELERSGVIKRGSGQISERFWSLQRPADPEGSTLAALLEERRGGR